MKLTLVGVPPPPLWLPPQRGVLLPAELSWTLAYSAGGICRTFPPSRGATFSSRARYVRRAVPDSQVSRPSLLWFALFSGRKTWYSGQISRFPGNHGSRTLLTLTLSQGCAQNPRASLWPPPPSILKHMLSREKVKRSPTNGTACGGNHNGWGRNLLAEPRFPQGVEVCAALFGSGGR